jgi:hypothetical protein
VVEPGREELAASVQDRVEGFGELAGAVADQEPEVLGVIAPGPSGGCGSAGWSTIRSGER